MSNKRRATERIMAFAFRRVARKDSIKLFGSSHGLLLSVRFTLVATPISLFSTSLGTDNAIAFRLLFPMKSRYTFLSVESPIRCNDETN